jgi:hypothetical protein
LTHGTTYLILGLYLENRPPARLLFAQGTPGDERERPRQASGDYRTALLLVFGLALAGAIAIVLLPAAGGKSRPRGAVRRTAFQKTMKDRWYDG